MTVYILGGYQTDFARNWTQAGLGLYDLLTESVQGALAATQLDPAEIEVAHIGNFVGELFCGQGQLGGMFATIDRAFADLPTARHEAACASGSMALLAASAEIEAGRYGLACVTGIELMRNVSGQQAAEVLGAAAWRGQEAQDAQFPWPALFSEIADAVDVRYGLRVEHLAAIAELNFANARRNPNAQARGWAFTPAHFSNDDTANPIIAGRLRKQDCGRITDGAATVFLASADVAHRYAARRGLDMNSLPRILGWGHRTAPMRLADKLAASRHSDYLFPHLRRTITDAYSRAGIPGSNDIDVIETHDCFTITEYVALDHLGLTAPGQSWRVIENGAITLEGAIPVNPGGGLIGAGHPVGATGVRMMLDGYKQVKGQAGDYQVERARRALTLNVGGSFTTVAVFIVGT